MKSVSITWEPKSNNYLDKFFTGFMIDTREVMCCTHVLLSLQSILFFLEGCSILVG